MPAGSVISQAPQAGVIASPGSKVSIVVSTGHADPDAVDVGQSVS